MSEFDDLGYDALQEASQEAWKERTRGTDMSTKPDYKASIPAAESLIREIENHLRPRNLLYAIQDIVDAALGGDPTAFAVAALIAKGGEITEALDATGWIEDWVVEVKQPGRYLVYGPIPAEEETTT